MGRPKKVAVVEIEGIKGPETDDEGILIISAPDLVKYELAQFKVANNAQAMTLKKQEMLNLDAAYRAAVGKAQLEMSALASSSKLVQDELMSLQSDLSKVYGLDLSKISYDDKTGRVFQDGEPLRRNKRK